MKILIAIFFLVSMTAFAQVADSTDLQFKVTSKKDTLVQSPERVFTVVERMPEFPGGEAALLKWVHDNLNYPDFPDTIEIRSRFVFGFVINEDGTVSNVEVKKGFGIKKYDDEMMKMFQKLPRFKPGMQAGKAVKVAYRLPVFIELSKEK